MDHNNKMLKGASIVNVRKMTQGEYNAHYWDNRDSVFVIELDNGISLYPSRDEEGNGGGVFFGVDENTEKCFTISEREQVDTTQMDNDEFGAFLRENCHK